MAHVLSLTDGTDTVPLSTTSSLLVNYTPQAPEMGDGRFGQSASDGEWVGDVFYRNVTEPVELYLYAASKSALQTAARAIERMLEMAARRRNRRDGPRVFLQLQVDGEASAWRSEVLAGRLELSQNALALWPNVGFEARLLITRRPYWEGAESELSISANGQSAATGGRTITNTNDANWVQIAGAQVGGSIPAPVRLDMENLDVDSHVYTNVWLICNAYANPSGVDMYRLASESVGGTGVIDVPGAGGTAVNIRWLLPDSLVDATRGGYVRALAVCSSIDFEAQLRGVLQYGDSGSYSTLLMGPEVPIDANIVDVGVFPIPPGAQTAGYDRVYFGLAAHAADSFEATVHHLELIPVSSEKRMTNGGSVGARRVPTGGSVVSDDIEGESYAESGSGNRWPFMIGRGGPLLVYPGVTQRIVVTWTGLNGNWFNDQSKIRVYMRPRRLTV